MTAAPPPNPSTNPGRRSESFTGTRPGSHLARLAVVVGSPIALTTTLMFYFGWVRTRVQARELGFNADVLGFSTVDYVLKSVNVLFPLTAVTLIALVASHAVYVKALPMVLNHDRRRRLLARAARAAPGLALLAVAVGCALAFLPATAFASLPVSLTLGILVALWGRGVRRDLSGRDPWTPTGHVLALLLLALVLFWDTERVARVSGEAFAYDIAGDPQQFAQILVYSDADLGLDAAGVRCGPIAPPTAAYPYRCTGLRLMEKTSGRYVLINELWNQGRGRVIVLTDSDHLRVEFLDAY